MDNPLSAAGDGKRVKAAPVVPPPHPTYVRVIELKLKKPSPAKLNVKQALEDILKRKYTQIFHANKKIQETIRKQTRKHCFRLRKQIENIVFHKFFNVGIIQVFLHHLQKAQSFIF